MDHGAGGGILAAGHADLPHQAVVAGIDAAAVDDGFDAAAGVLPGFGNAARFDGQAVGGDHRLGDGMMGKAFGSGCQRQQLLLRPLPRADTGYGKAAAGKGAGFIKDDGFCFGEGFQKAGALDEDAAAGRPADAPEEGERYADHQRAGTGDHQEHQRTLNPDTPALRKEERRQHRQQRRAGDHAGGVPMGKAGDKVFHPGLLPRGVFHQLQDAGGGGFAVEAFGTDGDAAGEIDGPADHTVAGGLLLRQAFPGEGGGIHRRAALTDDAVQRDLFAGVDDDGLAHRHLLGADPFLPAVPQHVGVIGTQVHQRGDIPPAFAHRDALEPFADLIEQHDRHGFPVIPQGKGADGGDGHQELLIQQVAPKDLAQGAPQDIPADDEIRHAVGQQLPYPLQRQHPGHRQQRRSGKDANQIFLLF